MTDAISKTSQPLETGTKEQVIGSQVQQVTIEPIKLIPEGFVEDDALPSIFLEDLEGDKEVWLLECPTTVDPSKLLGKQLHFSHQTSFQTDDASQENCIAIPTREDGTVCCLLSSCTGQSIKAVELQHAGKIRLNLSYDVPNLGSMIPDGTSVPLPEGLKTRHPFLGPNYREIVELMRNVKKNIFQKEEVQEEHSRKKKKKRKLMGADNQDEVSSENIGNHLDSYEKKFSVTADGVENFSPKKAKKKKHEYQHKDDSATTGESQEELEGTSREIKQTLKKMKKEKKHLATGSDIVQLDLSQDHFQEPELESESSNSNRRKRVSEVENEVLLYSKTSKKRKWESHHENIYEVDSQEIPEIIDSDHHHVSKKIKKEKNRSIGSGEYSNYTIDTTGSIYGAEAEFSSPKKKKKRDSYHQANCITADKPEEEMEISYDSSKQVSIKIKKEKKLASPYKDNSLNQHSQVVADVYNGNEHFSKKVKKEKKKHSLLQDESVTAEGFQDELTILRGASDHIPKKVKGNKRDSRYQGSTEDSQEELTITYEDSVHVSKKKKQKKLEMSAVEEIALEEESHETQEFMNEERKREKKMKKRHTMTKASMDPERLGLISEEETNVISSGSKKKKIELVSGKEMQLLSPKKEKKIKDEHLELDFLDTPKQKRKKDKRKSYLPEML